MTDDALLLENERLKEQVSSQESALNERDKQSSLLKEYNNLVLLEIEKLIRQVSNQESALNEREKQISSLLKEYNDLVHKNKENEEFIVSVIKDCEHCQRECLLPCDLYMTMHAQCTHIHTHVYMHMHVCAHICIY